MLLLFLPNTLFLKIVTLGCVTLNYFHSEKGGKLIGLPSPKTFMYKILFVILIDNGKKSTEMPRIKSDFIE